MLSPASQYPIIFSLQETKSARLRIFIYILKGFEQAHTQLSFKTFFYQFYRCVKVMFWL